MGPVVIELRQFLDPDRADFYRVFDLLSGETLGAEIRRIVHGKSLFVVGFGAGQVVGHLLHDACAAQHYVNVLDLNRFGFGLVDKLAVKTGGDGIVQLGAAIFDRLERSRVFPQ